MRSALSTASDPDDHLPRCRVHQRGLAVADVHAPEARHAIEDAIAVAVGEPDAIGARDDAHAAGLQRLMVREGVQVMRIVDAAQAVDIVGNVEHWDNLK
jgi:hypothetical protein